MGPDAEDLPLNPGYWYYGSSVSFSFTTCEEHVKNMDDGEDEDGEDERGWRGWRGMERTDLAALRQPRPWCFFLPYSIGYDLQSLGRFGQVRHAVFMVQVLRRVPAEPCKHKFVGSRRLSRPEKNPSLDPSVAIQTRPRQLGHIGRDLHCRMRSPSFECSSWPFYDLNLSGEALFGKWQQLTAPKLDWVSNVPLRKQKATNAVFAD